MEEMKGIAFSPPLYHTGLPPKKERKGETKEQKASWPGVMGCPKAVALGGSRVAFPMGLGERGPSPSSMSMVGVAVAVAVDGPGASGAMGIKREAFSALPFRKGAWPPSVPVGAGGHWMGFLTFQ